jgi:hypothetical protein
MAVAWAVADELLARAPTSCERMTVLQRLATIDLPVPGGGGHARYR